MNRVFMVLVLLIAGCSHVQTSCDCCSYCTSEYECKISCERDKGVECEKYSALEELQEAYQADLREYEQSEGEFKELRNEGK